MFFGRREIGFDCLQAVGSRRKHEMAERLRMRLMFGQGHKNLFVPEKNRVQIIPRALHALEMNPQHLAVGGMVVKLGALLPIFRDGPSAALICRRGGLSSGTGDVAIGLSRLHDSRGQTTAPPGSLVQHGGAFKQPRRSMRLRKRDRSNSLPSDASVVS